MPHHDAHEDDDLTSPDDEEFDPELDCADPEEDQPRRRSRSSPRTLQTVILGALMGISPGAGDSGE